MYIYITVSSFGKYNKSKCNQKVETNTKHRKPRETKVIPKRTEGASVMNSGTSCDIVRTVYF